MIKTREQQIRANLERLANIHAAAMSALEESVAILQAELESLSEPQLSGLQQPKNAPQRDQIAERSTFCAVYGGRRCPLGNTLMFKFLERIASHPGQYVSHADLFQNVWNAIREPLVIYPERKGSPKYMLLDGHIRLEILKDMGQTAVKCLVSTDDEGFTYNHKVNRLSAIQEHFMIKRAIKNGVSEDRIARTLNVDVASIKQKRDLLEGICPEAVELLRDKRATAGALRELRKVKPMRQIEMAELFCASHMFSEGYAKCLVAATPQEQMLESERPKEVRGLSAEDISRMEHEMATLGKEFKIIEETHGNNTLNLVVVIGYLKRLLDNSRISRFLTHHHQELLTEFQKIVESRMLLDPKVVTDGD